MVQAVTRLLGRLAEPLLWMATALHMVWGVLLVAIPESVNGTTSLHPFQNIEPGAALVFLASATVAAMALVHNARKLPVNALTFWAFIPQQALLMVSAGSAVFFSATGHFADGTVVPGGGWFVFGDQLPYILLALLHPFSVLRLHARIFPEKRDG